MKMTVADMKADKKFIKSRRGTGKTSMSATIINFLHEHANTEEPIYTLSELSAEMENLGLKVTSEKNLLQSARQANSKSFREAPNRKNDSWSIQGSVQFGFYDDKRVLYWEDVEPQRRE